MALSGKKLRSEIKTKLAALGEAVAPVRDLQTTLLKLQQAAVAGRKRELQRAEDGMRSPVPLSTEAARDNLLILDALGGIGQALHGYGVCNSVIRNIEREDRESKVTPRQRQEQVHKTRAIMAAAHQLGLLNRNRISLGLKPLKELPEDADALAELQGATP